MSRSCILIASAVLACIPCAAQQSGDANRNYTVNGNGSNQASVVTTNIPVPALDFSNLYTTNDAGAPVVWLASPNANPGQYSFGPNIIDLGTVALGFADIGVVVDGTQPGFLNSFFHTGTDNQFAFTVSVPVAYAGSGSKFCMLHFAPSSPVGFWVSQVQNVSFVLDPSLPAGTATPNPLATALVSGDDISTAVTLGWNFTFFNASYSTLYACSNGFVSSASANTWTEAVATFNTAPAKMCAWWDDLNVTGTASLRFFSDPANSTAEFTWVNVPEYVTTGSNSFKITIAPGLVQMDYGAMSALDGLVGLTGGAVPGTTALNLSAPGAGNVIPVGNSAYELFLGAAPSVNDLHGFRVTWLLDANGYPVLQF